MDGDFKFNKKNIRQVELLLPKLKYSVLPTEIINWLENFENDDIPHALDILKVFEYIPFNEFMSRINSLLKEVYKKIPIRSYSSRSATSTSTLVARRAGMKLASKATNNPAYTVT